MVIADSNLARLRIDLSVDRLTDFCRRWNIVELAAFGSVLRADFGPDSDVDMLVTFAAEAQWSLFDHVRMQDELSNLLQRNVDLISRKGIEKSRNYLRRRAILESSEVIYAAA